MGNSNKISIHVLQKGLSDKNIHAGHRKRLRASVDNDPELEALSDFEVLEYLLSFLLPYKDTNPLAHALIDRFGTIHGVFSASPQQLFSVKNMTEKAAYLLPNLLWLLKRAEQSRTSRSKVVSCVPHAIGLLRPYFASKNQERIYMLSLDINDRLMRINCICKGANDLSSEDICAIASVAARQEASKVLLAHNRPSGNLFPTEREVRATASIMMVMSSLGKTLYDHIIMNDKDYFSFFEQDILVKLLEKDDIIYGLKRGIEMANRLYKDAYVCENLQTHTSNLNALNYRQGK